MPKRRPTHRLVKIHRNYTVEDIALLLGIHKNTVRAWIKAGLPLCDARRPILILGRELVLFLKTQRAKNKQQCGPGKIYCMRCRAPRIPAGQMVDLEEKTDVLGCLVGICSECGTMMYRRVSMAKLPLIRGNLEVTIVGAERRVSESSTPIVNSDYVKES
jgi:Helix-turn-helix domain